MAVTITVNISDHNEKVLLHDLLDINTWVQAAVDGKINNCGKRMAIEATAVLKADDSVTSMPATDQGLQEALLARAGYKNRAQRDAE
uniref:Uncharacterized protein n=1 Tax=uncultured Bacteroidota bacterium TaxID=152509 RepID=A0A1B0Z2W1_9BACT|nr:hypothetical protein [uncultured Bacteroidetes bacterium]